MLRTSLLLAGALAVSASSLSAQEAEAPQVPGFAQQIFDLYKKPFQCDLDMKGTGDGAEFSLTGHIDWSNTNHFAFDLEITSKPAFSEEAETGKVSAVADGSFLWFDMNEPSGQRQVIKFKLATLNKLMNSGNGEAMVAQTGLPMSPDQIMGKLAGMPFTETDQGETKLISAKLDNSVFEDLQEAVIAFSLQVDKKSGFPQMFHLTVSEEDVDVKMTTSNVKFPETLPAEKFSFTAPEGVAVQDMTMMLEMMLMQGGGVESEF